LSQNQSDISPLVVPPTSPPFVRYAANRSDCEQSQ
jgi:hypothetical protein